MIVVIDNYDSFTYNLVQYLGELGADITVHRNDRVTIDELASLGPSHIVISPGPGRPEDSGISPEVIRHFYKAVPIPWCVFGSPSDRVRLRRNRRSGTHVDARKDLKDLPRLAGALCEFSQSIHCHPLSLPHCGGAVATRA